MSRTLKIGFVAWLSLGLIATAARAEYDSLGAYNSSVSSTLSQASSLLQPAGSALGAAASISRSSDPAQASQDDLLATVQKAQKAIQRSQEETDLRNKVQKWTNDNDRKKIERALPDILQANLIKQREQKYKDAQGFFQSLNSAPGVSGADVNTDSLEASCRSGVDFKGFKSLADQMGREPFRFLREEGTKILEEKSKAAKEAKIKNLAKLFDTLEKAQEKGISENDFQSNIAKGQSALLRDNSVDASIANLKFVLNAKKKEGAELDRDLLKVTKQFATQALTLNENDGKVQQLGAFFADNLEQYRQAVLDQATAGAQQLKANCDKNVELLGRDNPLAPNTLFNSAYQWVAKANPNFANSQFLQSVTQIAANLRCTDSVGAVEDLFGTNLQNAIAQIRAARDPRVLIQGAMSTLQAVASAQAQVGQALQPLMSDCQYAATQAKKIRAYIGQVQQQASPQAQDPSQQPVARRSSAGGSAFAAATHGGNGFGGGRRTQ